MCGILGFTAGTEETARTMLGSLSHRGPDDNGIHVSPQVVLGHARLSILDVSSGGRQPMFTSDKSVGIVFNGEIYNFRELRKDLERTYSFSSSSDTEVILYLYKEYGEKCFEKMNGMFALALYDFSKEKLILARDRLGKKPLYYFHKGGEMVFASELKAMLAHPSVPRVIDPESLNKYLFFDYVPTPHTILKDVYKLEPGTFLVFEKGKIAKEKFWKLGDEKFSGTFNEALNKLDSLVEQSVKARLVSDVPLGVFLSGGLDSSAVAYYAQKNSKEKIKTFSISFDEPSFDESGYAKRVAAHLGTDHREFKITYKDMLDLVPKIGLLVDEPMADASIIPTYLLSKQTKMSVTVALGGDGGDELFAGYPTFIAAKFRFLRKLLSLMARFLPANHKNFSLSFKLKKFVEGTSRELHRAHQEWLGSFQENEREELLKTKPSEVYKEIDEYYKEFNSSPDNRILYTYLRSYLMDEVMVKVDRASMMASLEARSPLLDHKLVEFVFSLPYAWKLKGFTTKFIFKKLMEGKLPLDIVYRSKKGFGVPIGSWFRNELKVFLDNVLSEKSITEGGFFNYDYIKRLKEEHFRGRHDHRKKLWNLLVFELWRKEHKL